MGYLGAVNPLFDAARALVGREDVDRFNGDSSNTSFTLTKSVLYATDVDVWVDNVHQEPRTDYDVAGNVLTFASPPATGSNNIYVNIRGSAYNNYAVVPDGSITVNKLADELRIFVDDQFTANGTGTTFELSQEPLNATTLVVSIDGVFQSPTTNYTLSGTTLTFTAAPHNNAQVSVRHLGFRTTTTTYPPIASNTITTLMLQDNIVTGDKLDLASEYSSTTETANGSGQTFTVTSGYNANSVIVFYNGIALVPVEDYDISGTTLTTTFTPTANSVVSIRYLPI